MVVSSFVLKDASRSLIKTRAYEYQPVVAIP